MAVVLLVAAQGMLVATGEEHACLETPETSMPNILSASLVALVVFTMGCGSSSAEPEGSGDPNQTFEDGPVAVGDTTTLELGKRVTFGETGIEVTFLRLAGDSRCPIGVTCIWEGDAEVRLLLDAPAAHAEVALHTTLDPRAVDVDSYTLELVDVLPYPIEGEPADPATRRIVITLVEADPGS